MISFHSISKGISGECGRRGGFFECVGIDEDIKDVFYKIASVSLCPPVSGQILVECMLHPPQIGDESYELYTKESTEIYESLKRRAIQLADAFNELEGVSCNAAEGAMYLFPSIVFPMKMIEAAKKSGMEPDNFYAMELLKATGICVVGGSGFGQKSGTFHIRSTFLASEEEMSEFIRSISIWHSSFFKQYC